ncbi:MAG TPA: MotA/TolQ/ExbB proton channel family protein [Spirochaetota bacterium]|nr:MotA/TolQ/ExbB proton channel family protein [Spirochaetota bacterium]HNT11765.1 MotA/TolQ/ExbB proton channel family protein [Spirochaetota bacterium]
MNMLTDNVIVKGGWVMIPIILGSIIALGIAIERGIMLWRIRMDLARFTDEIYALVRSGELETAGAVCARTLHPIARVFKAGLEHHGEEPSVVEKAMERQGNAEVARLEKNMNYLMAIVGVEPMLGFLGTILGLIGAFMAWEVSAESVTVSQLAAGIYQAMITTASGLAVAITYYVVYSVYANRIAAITRDLNSHGEEFLALITGAGKKKKR